MIPVIDESSFGTKGTKSKLSTKIGCKLDRILKSSSKASSEDDRSEGYSTIGDDEDKQMPASSPSEKQKSLISTDVQCLGSDDGDKDDEMNSIPSPRDGNDKGK